jgi:hypothetical protein
VHAPQIAQLRRAGALAFGALGLGFGRASAPAGVAHRFTPGRFEKDETAGGRRFRSLYVLLFRRICQAIFLKFVIAFVRKSRIMAA